MGLRPRLGNARDHNDPKHTMRDKIMTMTRKDFQAVADALNSACPRFDCPHNAPDEYRRAWLDGAMQAWHNSVLLVADACSTANQNFDRAKFLSACRPAGSAP
jgi:hypothetical protein